MNTADILNDNMSARVIIGLKAEHRIVSLPTWAWFWLDDFMIQNRISYQGILDTFGCNGNINNTLQQIAELHQDHCLRGLYKLANDNDFLDNDVKIQNIKVTKSAKKKQKKMPKIYKLFSFMPCATTLEAVYNRQNYNEADIFG